MSARYPLRTYQDLFLILFRLLDLGILLAVGYGTYLLTNPDQPVDTAHKAILMIALLLFTIVSENSGVYRPWRGKSFRSELITVAFAVTATIFLTASLATISTLAEYEILHGYWYLNWMLGLTAILTAIRLVVRPALRWLRRRGRNQRRILFVGMNSRTSEFIESLIKHPEFGFSFVGYIDDRSAQRDDFAPALSYLGTTEQLENICKQYDVDQIWFGYPLEASGRLNNALTTLQHFPVVMRQIINTQMAPRDINSITGILGTPVLDIDVNFNDRSLGSLLKSVEDKVIASIILVLISPMMLAIAIAVKLSSPGPVLYRQTRVTWRNKPFEMLKFRSMPVDVEGESGPQWARAGETRATRVGAFLRATSLDELPQFWNVLRGDMSIVGPRPERPEFTEKFKHKIPEYMKKHRVRAGITGWAQVNGLRGDTDLNQRIQYDLYYIRNGSLLFDLRIILMTLFKGFTDRNAY